MPAKQNVNLIQQGIKNLFQLPKNIKTPLENEFFETILLAKNSRLERIISQGQASPKGFWYNQTEDEWIIVLKGTATLITKDKKGKETTWHLEAGDPLLLKAHQQHRVEKTSTNPATVWLALYGDIEG